MKKMKLLTLMICVITLCFNACKKDKTETTPPSTYKGKQILSFGIVTPAAAGVIDTVAKTITIAIPQGTSLTSLNTNIVLPGGSEERSMRPKEQHGLSCGCYRPHRRESLALAHAGSSR